MFDDLSIKLKNDIEKERAGPRPVLSKLELDMHHAEKDREEKQRKIEDLKLQSRIQRAEIEKAEEEFRWALDKDLDLERPKELDKAKIEAAKKRLEERVRGITAKIKSFEDQIPKLMNEELEQMGRVEKLKIQKEFIKSGMHNLPIERDPRMESFLREKKNVKEEFERRKVEYDNVIAKVRAEKRRK